MGFPEAFVLIGEGVAYVVNNARPVALTIKHAMNFVIKEYVGKKRRTINVTQQSRGVVILKDGPEYRLLSGSGQPEVVNSRAMQSFLTIVHALLSICLIQRPGLLNALNSDADML